MNAKERLLRKLRRVLGMEHLDAVHLDLINILSGPDCRDLMLEVLAEAENKNVHNC